MTGIIVGVIIFIIGAVETFVINAKTEVPASGTFDEMPIRIKLGIYLIIIGSIVVCISAIANLCIDPIKFLNGK